MRTYTQLTREQRYQLSALLKMGHSQTEIAEVIGMHKSNILREFRRNRRQRGYRPKQAHYMATERRTRTTHTGRDLGVDREQTVRRLVPRTDIGEVEATQRYPG